MTKEPTATLSAAASRFREALAQIPDAPWSQQRNIIAAEEVLKAAAQEPDAPRGALALALASLSHVPDNMPIYYYGVQLGTFGDLRELVATKASPSDDKIRAAVKTLRSDWHAHHVDHRAAALWMLHGGSHYGPHNETVSMPMANFQGFIEALSSPPEPIGGEAVPLDKDDQIKHMVSRFLGWRLPEDFRPDGGINFDPDGAKKLNPRNARYEPFGTNLFSSTQAEAMVRYIVEGLSETRLNAVGAAEQQVGRAVYERIEALMDAKSGTPEGAELAYLADLASSVEEYGSWDGPVATAAHPPSTPEGEAVRVAISALEPFAVPRADPSTLTVGDFRRARAALTALRRSGEGV